MSKRELWQRYQRYLCICEQVGLTLDISRMRFDDGLFDETAAAMDGASGAMRLLEAGAIANPDEHRMVGHYWLRTPDLAPQAEIRRAVTDCLTKIKTFAAAVHAARIAPPSGERFRNLLLIGIGGSALGPQFVDDALSGTTDPLRIFFCDNTDPEGIDRTLHRIGAHLSSTLVIVVSKSGGTKETRNGMLEVARAYTSAGLDFAGHVVAVTSEGSALHEICRNERWLDSFPMWDWVGGRTSEMSAVGLLPAALQGIDIDALLGGARDMDATTRLADVRRNPAALMALMWYDAARDRGLRDMVVIPYKDRLALFSRYLQQLIMESLGKERDLDGEVVHQGIAVYGNKGSTDQHAYVQQLREGLHNFHVTFIEVLRDRQGQSMEVEPGATSGDYLNGFLLGTRQALYEKGRESMTITIDEVSPRSVGALIALYERTVGLFASLVNINAYHQPGVEAGKKAAGEVITLQSRLLEVLKAKPEQAMTAEEVAVALGQSDGAERVYKILEHLAANPGRGVRRVGGRHPGEGRYAVTGPGS